LKLSIKLNAVLEKLMPVITPFSLIMGVAFSSFFIKLQPLVPWLFALLTFSGSLGSGFKDIKNAAKNPLPFILSLSILHVLMPVIALGTGKVLFSGNPDIVTGMVLEFSVPAAVVSLIWVSIYKGNTALSLSILLIDTLLSPFITPLTIKLLLGSNVTIDSGDMIKDLIFMIAIPALLAASLNHFTKGMVKQTLSPRLAPVSKLCLMVVIMSNSSKAAPLFKSMTPKLFGVALTMLVLAALGLALGIIIARVLKLKHEDTVSLAYSAGLRNISAGAVIAAKYFSEAVIFPVMICTVFQQILASATGYALSRIFKSEESENN